MEQTLNGSFIEASGREEQFELLRPYFKMPSVDGHGEVLNLADGHPSAPPRQAREA